jgi:hypothetical protein
MKTILQRLVCLILGVFLVCSLAACSSAGQLPSTSKDVELASSTKGTTNTNSKTEKPRECRKIPVINFYTEEPKLIPNSSGKWTCCKDIDNDGVLDCPNPRKG